MRKIPDKKILMEIEELFRKAEDLKGRSEFARKCVLKARKLAKRNNISLKQYRRLFCKKCGSYFTSENSVLRIKKGIKTIKCLECGNYRRFKIF